MHVCHNFNTEYNDQRFKLTLAYDTQMIHVSVYQHTEPRENSTCQASFNSKILL